MSNTQAPNGFSQLGNLFGSVPNFAMTTYQIAFDNANTINTNDPVEQLSTGYIDIASGSTSTILGIFAGVTYTDSVLGTVISKSWNHPSTAVANSVNALVIHDPNAEFLAQCGGTVPTLTIADIGANVTYGGAGGTSANGISVAYIDASTKNTTNTLAFRITGLGQNINNDNASNYNWVRVKMNNQAYNTTTGV